MASSTEHCTSRRPGRDARRRHRHRVGRRVGEHRDRRLDLAEPVGGRRRRVGGEQQRVVEPVGDVGLVARSAPGPHLGHRHGAARPGATARRRARAWPASCQPPAGRPPRAARRGRRTAGRTSTSSRAIASSATDEVDAVSGDEGVEGVEVVGGRPSISATRPSLRTSDGAGSWGLAIATRPRPASSWAKPSRLTGFAFSTRKRPSSSATGGLLSTD